MQISISVTSNRTKFYKVETENLTAVRLASGIMEIYNRAGRLALCKDVDAQEALCAFENRGIDMIPVNARHGSFLVAPSAITFIACVPNLDTGNFRVTIGVKGFAGEPNADACNTDPDMSLLQLRKLLNAVKKDKFVTLQPDEGYAHFSNPHSGTALYINPETITRVYEGADKVSVLFSDTGWLHLKTPDLPVENFVPSLFEENPEANPVDLLHQAHEKRSEAERFFRHDLAEMLGRVCPSLTAIPRTAASLYCCPKDIVHATATANNTLNIRFRKNDWETHGLTASLSYPNDTIRDAALHDLREAQAACRTQPKPASPAPNC